jgi:hypothetical protein
MVVLHDNEPIFVHFTCVHPIDKILLNHHLLMYEGEGPMLYLNIILRLNVSEIIFQLAEMTDIVPILENFVV